MSDEITLAEIEPGKKGFVSRLAGGRNFIRKLGAMGILPGITVFKISEQPLQGPVIIRVKSAELAIGYGMAQKIFLLKDNK